MFESSLKFMTERMIIRGRCLKKLLFDKPSCMKKLPKMVTKNLNETLKQLVTISLWFFSPSSRNYTIYSNAHESLQGNMQSQVLSVHNNNTRDERYSHSFMCHLLPKLSGHVAHRSWMVITVSIKNGVQKSIWLLFKIYNFDFSHQSGISKMKITYFNLSYSNKWFSYIFLLSIYTVITIVGTMSTKYGYLMG